ncbi:MAG: ATP-binding protein [Pseudomonadota bacterium]
MSANPSPIDGNTSLVESRGTPPELAAAFVAFTETSARLERSYGQLQQRVGVLGEQLTKARSDRLAQLAKTERLASRLSGLLAALPGAVLVLDANSRVQEHNDGARELFGIDLAGQRWDDILATLAATSEDGGGELALADGRRLSVSVRPLSGEGGMIMLLTDVTETRELQAIVQRQERLSAMGEMMARLAHQARTPLATAILYASQLRRMPMHGNAAVFTQRVIARLKHLENMIEDMLCFARGNQGGSTPLPVDALTEGAVGSLPAERASRVQVTAPAQSAYVLGNRRALTGALTNLLENALAMDEHALVTLEACIDERAGQVRFTVTDQGAGIDPALRQRVFEPFFTTRNNGTGLGLAVVRSVAEGHGGRAYVDDSPPGVGARVVLELPHARAEAVARLLAAQHSAEAHDAG